MDALYAKKILVICPIASGGGVSEAFVLSLDMLRDGGFVPVAVAPKDFKLKQAILDRQIEFHEIAGLEQGGLFHLFRQSLALRNVAIRCNVDGIITNNGRFVSFLKILLPKIPLAAIYHGGKAKRFLNADRIITINDPQREMMIDLGFDEKSISVVDNALPVSTLPDFTFNPWIEQNGPVIGTLRLLEPAKGVDVLVRAIGKLASEGTRLKTRIGSSGSQLGALKSLVAELEIGDLVEFVGWIDSKDKFFKSMNIYVLPSRAEEWGIGIVEANAASLPVIATKTLGPLRIVNNGVTGVLVEPDDVDGLAAAIKELSANPDRCEELARNGYNHCLKNYVYPIVAPRFYNEIKKLLAA